jgi:hypothetical protein
MRVPKRINELISQKQEFINTNRDKLEKSVIKLQGELLDKIIADIVPNLDVKDGLIQDTKGNYQLLTGLDNIYNRFTLSAVKEIAPQIINTTSGIVALAEKYFSAVLTETIGAKFVKIIKDTAIKTDLRVGLKGGKMILNGFMDKMIQSSSVGMDLSNFMSKSITGQIPTKDFITGFTDLMKGVPREIIKDGKTVIIQEGRLEKEYKRYAYDLYQQYDRSYNTSLADEFGMNYFLYQGGLIEDSRDFCVCHNNKVWSREEAADWDTWKPYMGDYPEGYEIKQKNIYEIPSYLGYPGYQPLIDAGGYRCRHSISFISDELALDLRPDLKGTQ